MQRNDTKSGSGEPEFFDDHFFCELQQAEATGIIPRDGVELGQVIGKGAFAVVYQAMYKGQTVAAKQVTVKLDHNGNDRNQVYFQREMECNNAIANKYPLSLVKYFGHVLTSTERFLVFEYFPRGSLDKRIDDHTMPPLSWSMRLTILQDIAQAVKFMHIAGWLHNDIKSGNVFLGDDDHAKLGDFGLACTIADGYSHKNVGTPDYMAPEMPETGLTTATDIFSMAVLSWEIKEWMAPTFPELTVRWQIMRNEREQITPRPPALFALIQRMWHQKPEQRPAIEEVEAEFNSPELRKQLGL